MKLASSVQTPLIALPSRPHRLFGVADGAVGRPIGSHDHPRAVQGKGEGDHGAAPAYPIRGGQPLAGERQDQRGHPHRVPAQRR